MSMESTVDKPTGDKHTEDMVDQKKADNSDQQVLPDFSTPDHFSDVTLVVEDKPIHAHKTVLSLASPVWKAMFSADFKERRVDFLELPEKIYDDVTELLQFVYPPCKKAVEDSNVYRVLPLADEYQILWLKNACEEFLVNHILQEASSERAQNSSDFAAFCVQHLFLSQLYSLQQVYSVTVNITVDLPFSALSSADLFGSLDCSTLTTLFEKREENSVGKIKFLEQKLDEYGSMSKNYKAKCVEIARYALKRKQMGNYVRRCPSDESSSCACDSCIYFGLYFERIINQYAE